jgi:hypothetical protein
MKLGHGPISPDEGNKNTAPLTEASSQNPPDSASQPRRYPAFLVDRIDVPDKFAIAPLQSHTAEIRRSEIASRPAASPRRNDIIRDHITGPTAPFHGNFAD